eukprot:403349268
MENIPEVYKTNLEREFEAAREQDLQVVQEDANDIPLTLQEKVLSLEPSERVLTVKNYLDYICDSFDINNQSENSTNDSTDEGAIAINLPINTVTPSELEGLSLEDERKFRIYGCMLIQEAGILLKLPMITMATAQAILHRFYYRKSFMKCEILTVATASLFLAAKIEENPRKLKDVISVFDYVYKLNKANNQRPVPLLDISSFQFTDLKSEIVDAERFILKELGFSTYQLSTLNVHKFIYFYLRVLDGTKQLAQKAWNYVNDAYKTTVVVCFPPNVVACSAIYLASKIMNYPFPKGIEWWKIFGVKFEDIEYVSASILELYKICSTSDNQQLSITAQYVEGVVKGVLEQQKAAKEQHIKKLKEEGKFDKQTKWAPPVSGSGQEQQDTHDQEMKEEDINQLNKNAVDRNQPAIKDIKEDSRDLHRKNDKDQRPVVDRSSRDRRRDDSYDRRRHRDYDRDRHHRDRDRDYKDRDYKDREDRHKSNKHHKHKSSKRHRRDYSDDSERDRRRNKSTSRDRKRKDHKKESRRSRSKGRKDERKPDAKRKDSRSPNSDRSSSLDSR